MRTALIVFIGTFTLLLCEAMLSLAYASCATPVGNAGDMIYNNDYDVMQYCNGTDWIGMGGGSGSSSSSSSGGSGGMTADMIVAFPASTCPSGWTEYTAARGRFLRGIDSTGSVDPDGVRTAGSLQADAFQGHRHSMSAATQGGTASLGTTGGANIYAGVNSTVMNPTTDTVNDTPRTANETRPKNVAVIFCKYSGSGGGSSSGGGGGSCSNPTVDDTTSPSGIVAGGGVSPANAFNDNLTDYWSLTQGQTVTYDFGTGNGATVDKISMWPDVRANSYPGVFTVSGSNDAASWATLYSSGSVCAGWATGVKRSFSFTNTVSYRFYRVAITSNCGHAAGDVEVREIELGGTMACTGGGGGGADGDTLGDLSCANNDIPKFDGTDWVCAPDEGAGTQVAFAAHKGGTNQTIPTSTWTKLTWSTEFFDASNNFASGTFTAPYAGKYYFDARTVCVGGTSCYLGLYKNGAVQIIDAKNGSDAYLHSTATLTLAANDTVEAYVHNSGGTAVYGASNFSQFSGFLLGGGGGAGSGDNLGSHTATQDLAMGNFKVTGLGAPVATTDATSKTYVDSAISTSAATKVSKAGDSMTGALAMGTNKITGLGDPTSAQDAATKAYVDSLVGGGFTPTISTTAYALTTSGTTIVATPATTGTYIISGNIGSCGTDNNGNISVLIGSTTVVFGTASKSSSGSYSTSSTGSIEMVMDGTGTLYRVSYHVTGSSGAGSVNDRISYFDYVTGFWDGKAKESDCSGNVTKTVRLK